MIIFLLSPTFMDPKACKVNGGTCTQIFGISTRNMICERRKRVVIAELSERHPHGMSEFGPDTPTAYLIPASNDLSGANFEAEGSASIPAAVELFD